MNESLKTHAVIYPHAGGSASSLREFSIMLASCFVVHTMELPGRGRRRSEPLLATAEGALNDLIDKVPRSGKLVLIGHSLGAYIAFIIAHKLKRLDPDRSIILVVISNGPIDLRKRMLQEFKGHNATDELLKFAMSIGSVPQPVVESEYLKERFTSLLAADLGIADSIPASMTTTLDGVPILCVYGDKDQLVDDSISKWSLLTNSKCKVIKLEGGHFILDDQPYLIAKEIQKFAWRAP